MCECVRVCSSLGVEFELEAGIVILLQYSISVLSERNLLQELGQDYARQV